jgi:predicted HAD superfamily phosphohydrolase YqeG
MDKVVSPKEVAYKVTGHVVKNEHEKRVDRWKRNLLLPIYHPASKSI